MLIFDAHLDLAMNALEWNRDLTWTVERLGKAKWECQTNLIALRVPFR